MLENIVLLIIFVVLLAFGAYGIGYYNGTEGRR